MHLFIYLFIFITGTGFKTAPAVARLLSELARGVEPFMDVSHYRLSRFSKWKNIDEKKYLDQKPGNQNQIPRLKKYFLIKQMKITVHKKYSCERNFIIKPEIH